MKRGRRTRIRTRAVWVIPVVLIVGILLAAGCLGFWFVSRKAAEPEKKKPDELLMEYMQYIPDGNYEAMYGMLDRQSHLNISLEDFVERNKNIYEGIEAANIRIEVKEAEVREDGTETVNYQTTMDTAAGEISFFNQVEFHEEEIVPESEVTERGERGAAKENGGEITSEKSEEENAKKNGKKGGKKSGKKSGKETLEYKMAWSDWVIFPQLGRTDKVRVRTDRAKRGNVLDRDGKLLAGDGTASLVGLVPGKMNREPEQEDTYLAEDLQRLSDLLGISVESITKKLSAGWVKEDSLVPLKTLKKVDEMGLKSTAPDEENIQNKVLQEELLTVAGVMITDTTVRSYPLEEKAAHLVGYVQNVTAEDLEKQKGEGYLTDSVIGRTGMEGLYEKELKGQNGTAISIVTSEGVEKLVLASIERSDGKDIRLTIDSQLQASVYDAFQDRKSCTVAMNPLTGEILALVNTPSYDNNDFILGLSQEKWASLNEDERNPMLNRFRQRFAPGSSFKPITGAIGLTSGVLTPDENFGKTEAELSWQKDASWGGYEVTTLHGYSPVNLEYAYIYSDNIYFAKAALKIGAEDFMAGLDRLGFNQEIPFEIALAKSQYSNADKIETEIQLADSGYGQGEMLVNPVHLASLYTMFPNRGTVLKPYLLYQEEPVPETWIEQACTAEAAEIVERDLVQVVNFEHGTGHKAMRANLSLAGKTGTAEIKASKEDTSGTELGWFAVYTTDTQIQNPILLVSMVEDVKNDGGSGLVVERAKRILDSYIP